ncbi:MAG: hypothetical protein ABI091_24800 [Ferruginibacter sp.]
MKSLEIYLTEFFKDLYSDKAEKFLIKRSADYQHFEKEAVKCFHYKRILTSTVNGHPVDFVLLQLEKGAKRNHIAKTDTWEYKYQCH